VLKNGCNNHNVMKVFWASCLFEGWGRVQQKNRRVKENNKQEAQNTIITYYESEEENWGGIGVLGKANVRSDAGCGESVMLVRIIMLVMSDLTLIV